MSKSFDRRARRLAGRSSIGFLLVMTLLSTPVHGRSDEGDSRECRRAIRSLRASTPDTTALRIMAEVERQNLACRRALRERLEDLARSHPDHWALRLGYADALNEGGQWANARNQYRGILDSRYAWPPWVRRRALARTIRIDLDEAKETSDPSHAFRAWITYEHAAIRDTSASPELLLVLSELIYVTKGRRGTPASTDLLAALRAAQGASDCDSANADAWMLRGLIAMERGMLSEADYAWNRGIELLPPPDAQIFRHPEGTLGVALGRDPNGSTPENESMLEYWRRLVVADVSLPRRGGPPAWSGEIGAFYARYGVPSRVSHRPHWQWGATMPMDPGFTYSMLGRPTFQRGALPEAVGERVTVHECDGQTIVARFQRIGSEGWVADDQTSQILGGIDTSAPMYSFPGLTSELPSLFCSTASRRGENGRSRVDIALGFPQAGRRYDHDWPEALRLEVRSASNDTLANWVEPDVTSSPYPAVGEAAVAEAECTVPPGSYLVQASWREGDTRRSLAPTPLIVQDYGGSDLQVSQLKPVWLQEDALPSNRERYGSRYVSNPPQRVGDARRLDLLAEVYGLAADAAGRVSYRTEYAVVPRAYAESVARWYAERVAHAAPASLQGAAPLPSYSEAVLGALDAVDAETGAPLLRLGQNYLRVGLAPAEARTEAGALPLVVRGLSLSPLEPGPYVVVVRVSDLRARSTPRASASLNVQLGSDRDLFSAE